MSDFFKDAARRGRELAGKALHSAGEAAGNVLDTAQGKLSDANDGLLLARLEERADDQFGGMLTLFKNEVGWRITFGDIDSGPDSVCGTFKDAAEAALATTTVG